MEAVLSRRPPFRQERHHRLGRPFDELRHIFGVLGRKMRQHILFRGEPGRGPPYAQLDPEKLLGVEGRNDVQNPPMAPGTAPRPPRPGHEPKPKKEDATTSRRRY